MGRHDLVCSTWKLGPGISPCPSLIQWCRHSYRCPRQKLKLAYPLPPTLQMLYTTSWQRWPNQGPEIAFAAHPSLSVHMLWSVFQAAGKQTTVRHLTDPSRNHFSRPGTLSLVLSDNGPDLGHSVQMIYLGRGVLHHHHVTTTKLNGCLKLLQPY